MPRPSLVRRPSEPRASDELTRVDELVDELTVRASRIEAAGPLLQPAPLAFERIVVGADGSPSADQAAAWARAVANVFGGRTWAVSAVAAPDVLDHYLDFLGGLLVKVPGTLEEEADAWARAALERAASLLEGVPVEQVLRRGPAAREIADAAAERGADLVVVGSHGHRGLERALLGSVADAVKHHARASVLIAKNDPPPKAILAPTDGSRASKRAVAIALKLGRAWRAPVTVLYVFEPLLYGPEARVARQLERAIGDIDVGWTDPRAQVDVAFGAPAAEIAAAARRHGAGLIVMGARGLGGPRGLTAGSVSNRVSHEAEASLLLVKEVPP
ncbi:MAG TPA: universal stress protein [Candidatus Thermoplasmatota archaeon]|nr:universal stress protein [Candidatus Thermoplasmatota archaeon]